LCHCWHASYPSYSDYERVAWGPGTASYGCEGAIGGVTAPGGGWGVPSVVVTSALHNRTLVTIRPVPNLIAP